MLQTIKAYPFGSACVAIIILGCLLFAALVIYSAYVQIRDDGFVSAVSLAVEGIGWYVVVAWALGWLPRLIRWLDALFR